MVIMDLKQVWMQKITKLQQEHIAITAGKGKAFKALNT